jgi:uncharacterized protein YbjT (DUF2867 family)
MKVLVAGATGGCGRLVVRRLSDLGVATRVLTRDARRATSLGSVEVVEGNALSPEDCRRAIEGCQAVISTLGDRWVPPDGRIVDGDGVINLAEATEGAGVRRFILVSSAGAGIVGRRFSCAGSFGCCGSCRSSRRSRGQKRTYAPRGSSGLSSGPDS